MATSNPYPVMKTSPRWAQRRTQAAAERLGETVLRHTLAYAWHLQGVETSQIAQALEIPADTLSGLFKRVLRDGLPALEDRRRAHATSLPGPPPAPSPPSVSLQADVQHLHLSLGSVELPLDRRDTLLCRTVLFVLLETGGLRPESVADALGLSRERVRKLRAHFRRDGAKALIDHRQGQTQDYSMPPETKAEFICQFVNHMQTGRAVSAPALKAAVERAGKSCPSPGTLRVHLKKMGLSHVRADEDEPATAKKGLRTT